MGVFIVFPTCWSFIMWIIFFQMEKSEAYFPCLKPNIIEMKPLLQPSDFILAKWRPREEAGGPCSRDTCGHLGAGFVLPDPKGGGIRPGASQPCG